MFLLIKKKFSRGCKKSNHKIIDLPSNMCEECLNNSETEVINEITHMAECNNNCNECKNRDKCSHSSTTNITRLDPIIYCMVIYDQKLDKIHKIEEYVGDDCIKHFIRTLEKLEEELSDLIDEELPLNKNTIPRNVNPVNVK